MRKGGVAEAGRNLPPPFHGPQQLETIYYHHGYPIVSYILTNDIYDTTDQNCFIMYDKDLYSFQKNMMIEKYWEI